MKDNLKAIVNYFFELGMLKKTPRSGFQFLGSGRESVAEHVFRTALIGLTLGRLAKDVDAFRLLRMCLFHDLPESRTGDLNYVNKQYVQVREAKAVRDLANTLPFGDEIELLLQEFNEGKSREAMLARDADQLDLILELKEHQDLGNRYAEKWIEHACRRLKTDLARKIATQIIETDSTSWWFEGRDHWWTAE
ncbi:MAG: HD domain-containing protein [Deltaproteobacteria bacterium]|nr:HD domain-containing protein [Deltaproteobacteria bacterium]MBW2071320.1 HD domain-containing protein [Deltaproteobacteria bacterium]